MNQVIVPSSMNQSQKPAYSKPSVCISTDAPTHITAPMTSSYSWHGLLLGRGKLQCQGAPFLYNTGSTAKVRIYLDCLYPPAIQ